MRPLLDPFQSVPYRFKSKDYIDFPLGFGSPRQPLSVTNSTSPVAMSIIELSSWLGSPGLSGSFVMLLIGADYSQVLGDPPQGRRLPIGGNILAVDMQLVACLNVGDGFPVIRNPSLQPIDAFLESAHSTNMRPESALFQPGTLQQLN